MPRREEDPTLVGLVISFDPEEEVRRYEEEEKERRLAKKLQNKKAKKDDSSSSKCSGATASTSKSESVTSSPVPDKIVTTTIILEESSSKEDTSEDNKNNSKEKKEKSSKDSKEDARKGSLRKSKSKRDVKKSKSKRDLKKEARKEAKKEAKSQKRAARNIQRIARGYLVRRDMEQRWEQNEKVSREAAIGGEGSVHNAKADGGTNPAPKKTWLGARLRRVIAPRKKEADAASRLQNAFRFHRFRQLFKMGDKARWRLAFANFFIFHMLAPLERMRQKQRLMQGPAKTRINSEDDSVDSSSTSSDEDEPLQAIPLYQSTASVDTSAPDLLDVIPEDSSQCDQVCDLLAPMPSFGEGEESSVASDELRADMLSPESPSTVSTTFTSGSLSPRRVIIKRSKKKYRASNMHKSCPNLRLDSV